MLNWFRDFLCKLDFHFKTTYYKIPTDGFAKIIGFTGDYQICQCGALEIEIRNLGISKWYPTNQDQRNEFYSAVANKTAINITEGKDEYDYSTVPNKKVTEK
jgi:hypothetical protein